jgi:hypothetical protein
LKIPSFPIATLALFAGFAFAISTVAQAPQAIPPAAGSPPAAQQHQHPAPTNLKVLPKNLTGEQVHEIMEKWAGSLGVHCDTCHAAEPGAVGPNGRPRLKFADDSKPEKSTARLMYTMTEGINRDYISMVDDTAAPVTCGTCHRGHLRPEPFVNPEDEVPGPPQGAPAAKPQ